MMRHCFKALTALTLLTGSSLVADPIPFYIYSLGPVAAQVRLQDHIVVYMDGPIIELEDGSRVTVASSDMYKLWKWFPSDIIRLEPTFKDVGPRFLLINERIIAEVNSLWTPSEAVLGVDFVRGPLHAGSFTHHITGLDVNMPGRKAVYLDNCSLWEIDERDHSIVMSWKIGHTVILGTNPVFWGSWRPSNTILIDVESNTYVRARQL